MLGQLKFEIKELLEAAKAAELVDHARASALYLELAEHFVMLAKAIGQDSETASRAMVAATECYLRARSLENKPVVKELECYTLAGSSTGRSFADIAALDEVKQQFRLKVIEPLRQPALFARFGRRFGGGLLLYGPPGCGKTLFAEAAAGEAGVPFFYANAAELRSKWVGETEKNISELFQRAREQAPAIIFFDEFDALGSERSSADASHVRNTVSAILAELDGFGKKDAQLVVLAASNAPWDIDLALRRPGRFGTAIFIPPPDVVARAAILRKALAGKPVSKELEIGAIARKTVGFSGAELVALCEDAIEEALKDSLRTGKIRELTSSDFARALRRRQPGCFAWFELARARLASTGQRDYFKELFEHFAKIERERAMQFRLASSPC